MKVIFSVIAVFGMTLSNVQAQTSAPAPGAAGPNPMSNIIGIVLMFGVFFFLIIWPQMRRAKKQSQFLLGLKKGDAVVTQGGVFGRITGITDKVVTLEIATKVFVRVDRQSISGLDPYATANDGGTQS